MNVPQGLKRKHKILPSLHNDIFFKAHEESNVIYDNPLLKRVTRCFAIDGWPSPGASDHCYRVSEYFRHDRLNSEKPKSVAN